MYVDMFPRRLAFDDLLFPFPTSIDWTRVVVFRTLESSDLLHFLISMPTSEVDSRLSYLRSIASRLIYDTPGLERDDAPAAFIAELERRFLGGAGHRGKQAWRGAGGELLCDLAANRTAGSPRCHHAT